MNKKYYLNYEHTSLPHCCGVLEIGEMRMQEMKVDQLEAYQKRYPHAYTEYKYDSAEEAYDVAFKQIIEGSYDVYDTEDDDGIQRPKQVWFVKYSEQDEYTHEYLRQKFINLKGVVRLGTYFNPNSHNTIDGYFWFDGTKQITE